MTTRSLATTTPGNYGSVCSTHPTDFNSVKGMHFDRNQNKVTPISDIGDIDTDNASTLNISNINYVVREWTGPWWKGSCFRKPKIKTVLRDISLQVKSGEITAILGNSGIYDSYDINQYILTDINQYILTFSRKLATKFVEVDKSVPLSVKCSQSFSNRCLHTYHYQYRT